MNCVSEIILPLLFILKTWIPFENNANFSEADFFINVYPVEENIKMTLYDQLPSAGKDAIEHSRKTDENLDPHVEGGSFKEIFRNAEYTIIKFRLSNSSEVSRLHRLKNIEEQWLCFESFLNIVQIDKNEQYTEEKLTSNNSITIKSGNPGNWFGAYATEPVTVYCICNPPFEYENFELLEDAAVIEKIRSKIPNFKDIIDKLTV